MKSLILCFVFFSLQIMAASATNGAAYEIKVIMGDRVSEFELQKNPDKLTKYLKQKKEINLSAENSAYLEAEIQKLMKMPSHKVAQFCSRKRVEISSIMGGQKRTTHVCMDSKVPLARKTNAFLRLLVIL